MPQQDDWKAIHAIADRLTPQLRREFLTAIDQLQGRIDVRAIATALRRGRIRDVEVLADAFPEELRPAVETLNTGFRQGGQVAAVQAGTRFRETIRFDQTNPEAIAAAERNAARLVTNVSRETRKTIREIIAGGFRDQRTVDDMARDIRAHIGLTRGDSRMVTALRRDLNQAGTPQNLIDAQINQLIARKTQARAVTIARTETINSANAGQLALWQQMRANGVLPTDGLFKQWIVTPDDKLCERCGALNEQIQPLDLPFEEPGGGTVMTPALHPRCRCAMGLTTTLPDKDRRKIARRRGVALTGVGLLLARQLAGPALRYYTGKTVWQHLGPHIIGPRKFVGMALPFVRGAARYDGRLRTFIGLHDELQDVLRTGHWTPRRSSPMWEVGVKRPLYTPPTPPRPTVTFADPVRPPAFTDPEVGTNLPARTPVTSQMVRTPTLVEGTYHPDELLLFIADRTGLSDYIAGVDLHDRLTNLIAAATFHQDTRVIALANDTQASLAGYMHTVRTGQVAGMPVLGDSAFDRSIANPLLDATWYSALVSVVHELLHAQLWQAGVGKFKVRHWATRFMEEGLVENTARRYTGGLFFGGQWGRTIKAPATIATREQQSVGAPHILQQFERAIAYTAYVRELRWYEQTFGTEAYYRLFYTPLDFRGEVAVDQIKGWLPTALAEHPSAVIREPRNVARLVDAMEKADYRAVLRLWQDGTLRELTEVTVEADGTRTPKLSPVMVAAKFSLSSASAKELLKATGAPITDLSKAAEPVLEEALHQLPPHVREALVLFARLAVLGKELRDLQQAAKNLRALWTASGLAAPKIEVLLSVLEAAEAITTAVDTVTGGPLSDPAELIKATHSAAISAKKLLEQLRSGAPDLIDTAPVAARLVAAVQKVVGSTVVAEVATAALTYFTPGLTAVQGVIRVVKVAKGARKIRAQVETVLRDVLALITNKQLRPDDVWDPDMRPVIRRSRLFWSNLRSGWWTPTDRHLPPHPRPLILEGDGQPRPVGMTWPGDVTLVESATGFYEPRRGALTTFDYDARSMVEMMVDLFELNPIVQSIHLGDATVRAMGARAAFEPGAGALRFHPKMTNRLRWLMAAAHDPALGGAFLARAEPEHLLDVHTIVHELMHARANTPWSPDPINELLEEGLTELYARRYSAGLFYGRDYARYANVDLAARNEIGAYAPFVHSMRVFERAFGWGPTRALYFAPPAERLTIGATLIRAHVRHLLDTGQAHELLRGDTEAARIGRAHVLALLDVQPDRAIVGMFFMPLRLPGGGLTTLFELWPTFDPQHLMHVLTDAARFLPDLDGDPGGSHLPPFPMKRLPERPIQPHQRLDTLLAVPTHPTWVQVPFAVLDDLQATQLAASTNWAEGTWQTIPLDRVVTTQRTVTREVVERKILDAPPVLGTTPPGRRDFGVVRAIEVGDRFYLADGTHQTVAAWARGETEIAAFVSVPKRPLELTPTEPEPRPMLDRPVATPEPRPVTDTEKTVFQQVYAEQINQALGSPLATLDDPLAAIRGTLREELKTLPVEVAQAIERDAAHVARYAANPLRNLRTFEPPLDDPMPLVDPFHGVPFGDHTPAAQSRLISFLTVTTGEQFKPYGSVAKGETSTNDIDILVLHPTHGMSVAEQRVWWAGQEQLAHEAEDAVRAAVARGDLTQDQALAQLAGDPPPPAYVGALERLGFSYVSSIPGFPEPDGTLGTVSVARFSRPDTGHTVEVWEHHPEPPRPSAFADEDDGIAAQPAPKITPAQRKAAVAKLAGMVRITEVEDVSVHPLLSRMHPEFDSVVSFATQVADVLGVTPRPITVDPHDPRLIATQDGFNSAHVRDLLLHPEDHVREDVPTLIDFGGHLLVQDGHHRLIANKLLGVPVEAEVYDLSHFTQAEVEATIQSLLNTDIERGFARLAATGQALADAAPVPTLLAKLDAGIVVAKDVEPEVADFLAAGATEVPGRLYRGLSFQRDALASFLERRMLTTATGQPFATELPPAERNLAAQDLELAVGYTRNAVGYGSPGGDYGLLVEIEPTPAMRTAMEGTHDPTKPKGFLGTRMGSGVMQLPAEDVSFVAVTRAWVVRYDWVEEAETGDTFLRSWHIEPVPDAILHPPPKLKLLPDRAGDVVYYHGTNSLKLAAIRKQGLVPGEGEGAVAAWAGSVTLTSHSFDHVYLTRNRTKAIEYAEMVTADRGRPAVIAVRIPADQVARLSLDADDPGGVRFEGTIPPEWFVDPDDDIVGQAAPQHPVLPGDMRVVRAGAKFAWTPDMGTAVRRRFLFNVRNRQILVGAATPTAEPETHAGIVHALSKEFEDVSKRDDDYLRGWFDRGKVGGSEPALEIEYIAQTATHDFQDADALGRAVIAEEQVVAFVRTAKDRLSLPDDLAVFIEFRTATLSQRTTVGEILHPKVDDGIVGMARPGGPHDLPATYLRDGVLTPVPAPEILVNRTNKMIEVVLHDIGMIGVSEPFRDFGLEPGFLHVDYIRLDAEAHNQGFGLWLYEEAFRQAIALGERGIASAHSMRSPFANRAWAGLRRRYQVETLWHGEGPARTPVDYLRSLDRIDQPRPLPLTYVYDPGPQFSTNEAGDLQRDDTPRSERRPMPPVRVEVFNWSDVSDNRAGTHVPGVSVEIKLRGIGHLDLSDRFPSIPGGPRRSVNPRDGYLWVDSALVTEGARGQGIGRWFYEEGLRQALARGFKGIASQHLRSKDADAVWAGLKRRYTVQTEAHADYFTSFEPPDDDGRAVVDRAIARLEDIAKREALGPTHPIYDEAEGDPRHIHMARFVKAVLAHPDPYTLTGILPAAVPERVALADLIARQPYVGVDRVRRVLEGEFAGTVSVLRIKGELYLSDGHHRVAAASLKDETHIDALVTTIPDPDLRDASGRDLGGYTGPERRAVPRTEPDLSEDAVFQRMRDKLARGELTGTEAARQAAEMRSRLDAARKDKRRADQDDDIVGQAAKLPKLPDEALVVRGRYAYSLRKEHDRRVLFNPDNRTLLLGRAVHLRDLRDDVETHTEVLGEMANRHDDVVDKDDLYIKGLFFAHGSSRIVLAISDAAETRQYQAAAIGSAEAAIIAEAQIVTFVRVLQDRLSLPDTFPVHILTPTATLPRAVWRDGQAISGETTIGQILHPKVDDDGIVGMARATPAPQTKGEQQTLDWIRMIASQATGTLGEGGFVYRNIEDLLLQHGQFYRPAALTEAEVAYLRDILKGRTFPMQQCYSNAQSLLWRTPPEAGMDLRYHEGWTYMGLIPVRHAWLTLNGKVVDLTMRDAGWGSTYDPTGKLKDRAVGTWNIEQRAYFGLELSRDLIVTRMQETDEWHTLLDDFERRWPLLRQPYVAPDAPPDPDDSVGMAWRNPTTGEYQLDRSFREDGTRFVVLSPPAAAHARVHQNLISGVSPHLRAHRTLGEAEAAVRGMGLHPRETGQPVYLVQVKIGGLTLVNRGFNGEDLYQAVSSSRVAKVWALYPDGGVFELPQLPKPSKVAIATKPIVDPLMRRAATTLHEDLWAALREGMDHEGEPLWEHVAPEGPHPDDLSASARAWRAAHPYGPVYDADAGLHPERLVAKMVDMFRATEVREIEIDSAYADRQHYLGAWDYRHHKLMLSTATTNDLRVILRKARAAAELNLRLMPEDFEPLTVVLKALETVVHEIVHALDLTPFVSDRQERWIEEGLTELRSRRIAMALIFGGQSRHVRNGPGAEAFARGSTDGSYEGVTRAMRWYERTFGTAAIEELWRTGHRVTPMGARLRGLLRRYLTANHPTMLPLLNAVTNARLVEMWGEKFFLRLVPDLPHAGMRPITVFELRGELFKTEATPGSSRDIPQAQVRPWEPPPPRHVFDPDVRTFLRLRASLVRTLNDGRWIVRSEPTLLRGLRFKQPVSVFQYTEIPFWFDEGRTTILVDNRHRSVEGTYNVAGLIQFMAWHLGVADKLAGIEFSPFIVVQGPTPTWSTFTVRPEGDTRRVLHVHTSLRTQLAGFLHDVRHGGWDEAIMDANVVVALRDIAATLLALEATPAPVEDRWETFLRIGFTELYVQRWGQAILFGHRAPVPDDPRLNRGLDDPGGVFQPLQQPVRWFEQRFGRQAALDIWRGPDRFFRLRDELHRWLLWAFHRHPDPEVRAHAVELFDLVRFGPMGNQGWGELESNAVPLFFRGLWEDLDRGKHGLRFWREALSNPGSLDDAG